MSKTEAKSLDQLSRFIDDDSAFWGDESAEQLFSIADLLVENKALARALTDNGVDASVRVGIARDLLTKHASPSVLKIVEFAVGQRWGAPSDLVDALAAAGVRAALAGAEGRGELDQLEDEIFRFARTVAANGELELALSDPAISNQARDALLDDLLGSRINQTGLAVVKYVLNNRRGRSVSDSLDDLVRVAASRRGHLLAEVTSALPLDESQRVRLTKILEGIYGRTITLQNEVDPSVIGGIAVQVGDDLIDGTVAESLEQARRRLTQGV
jgi:F-type H+-transporting ATPase subunit delta